MSDAYTTGSVAYVLQRAASVLAMHLEAELAAQAAAAGVPVPPMPAQIRICRDQNIWPTGNATPDIAICYTGKATRYRDGNGLQSPDLTVSALVSTSARTLEASTESAFALTQSVYAEAVERVLFTKLPTGTIVRTVENTNIVAQGIAPLAEQGQQLPRLWIAADLVTLTVRCAFPARTHDEL